MEILVEVWVERPVLASTCQGFMGALQGLPGATRSNLDQGLTRMAWNPATPCAHKELIVKSSGVKLVGSF